MKQIQEYLDIPYINEVQTYLDEDAVFLDIETLGLSPKYYPIYLIGTITWRDGQLLLRQYFCEDPREEGELLFTCFSDIKDIKTIITFNGNGFDIPYLRHRGAMARLKSPIDDMESLDLYKVAKRHQKRLGLSRCNQTTIEAFLGLNRTDQYDGGKLIPVYHHYAMEPNENDEQLLLLHNYEDIKGMIKLLSLLSYDKLFENAYTISSVNTDDPEEILVNATLSYPIPKPLRLLNEYAHLSIYEDRIRLILHPIKETLRHFYPDTKSYVYLKEEDTVILKELATGIPKDKKTRATRDNCCLKADGYYLPLFGKLSRTDILCIEKMTPLFRTSYKSKEHFVRLPLSADTGSSNENSPRMRELSDVLLLFCRHFLIEKG